MLALMIDTKKLEQQRDVQNILNCNLENPFMKLQWHWNLLQQQQPNFHFHFPFSHKQPQLKMNAVKEKGRKIGNQEEEKEK